jgi:hypothetical protein
LITLAYLETFLEKQLGCEVLVAKGDADELVVAVARY